MATIRDIKYLYTDKRYGIECFDVISTLSVAVVDYEVIVKTIKNTHNDIDNIRVLSFTRK